MANQLRKLANGGFVRPDRKDWRVRITFEDGSTKVIRVTPGRISEERAIEAAKKSIGLLDDSVVSNIQTTRAGDESLVISPEPPQERKKT